MFKCGKVINSNTIIYTVKIGCSYTSVYTIITCPVLLKHIGNVFPVIGWSVCLSGGLNTEDIAGKVSLLVSLGYVLIFCKLGFLDFTGRV